MASATGQEERHVHGEKAASWLSKVFELNPAAINWPHDPQHATSTPQPFAREPAATSQRPRTNHAPRGLLCANEVAGGRQPRSVVGGLDTLSVHVAPRPGCRR
jgi:hypothetical protein